MATTTELWVFNSLNHIAVGIDDINDPSDADRSALWVDEGLCVRHFSLTELFNLGNREVIANVMGGVASTLSLTQSGECVRGLHREPFRSHQGSLADHL